MEERAELVDFRVHGRKVRDSLGVDKLARVLDTVQAAGAGSKLGLKVLRRLSKSACALSDKLLELLEPLVRVSRSGTGAG